MISQAPLLVVVLLALLVGAAIPVLYQLYQVLRRARAVLDSAGPCFERAMDQVGQAADRLNGICATLEAQSQALRPLLEASSRLGHSIDRSRRWLGTGMTLGSAIGPAVMAGVRTFFSRTGEQRRNDRHPLHRSNKGIVPDEQPPRVTSIGETP
jgi:hypothetical protein